MKTVFSGVAPSGVIHIGNYLGAIKNWVELQNDYRCIFCVVDLHAITTPQDPQKLSQKILEVAKIYLAAGIDPQKSIIFVQSDVKEHAELVWILNTITRMSDLLRMTQFKEKAKIDPEKIIKEIGSRELYNTETYMVSSKIVKLLEEFLGGINKSGVGLFGYPVLMAADILLYKTDAVPVGEDQLQHVELTRTLAERFNGKFSQGQEIFVVPKAMIKKEGARIMGLDDPAKKMSKSALSSANYIALTDPPQIIREKIKKAVTDSGKDIVAAEDKPALSNLLTIYSLLSGQAVAEIEKEYRGKGYAEFKDGLAEAAINFLSPFQKKYADLDDAYVSQILNEGAQKARKIAGQTLQEVKEAMGLIY